MIRVERIVIRSDGGGAQHVFALLFEHLAEGKLGQAVGGILGARDL